MCLRSYANVAIAFTIRCMLLPIRRCAECSCRAIKKNLFPENGERIER